MSIPVRIEKLMKEKGITKYRLSKESGVPYTTLTQILSQRTKSPQIDSLSLIADYFGVNVDYLLGQSASAIIEDQLKLKGMTLEDVAERTKIRIEVLRNIESVQPIEPDYEMMDRIARVLEINPKSLRAAFSRQEPPAYDGPADTRSIEEIFGDEDFEQDSKEEEKHTVPSWANPRDVRDFKKMLEEDAPVMFDGVPIEGAARQRVMDVLTGLFWEAKQMNKEKYGRKKKPSTETDKE